MENTNTLLTSRKVREVLGGISEMTLWRWLKAPALQFPPPMKIRSRNYWRREDIEAWLVRQDRKEGGK